VLPLAVHNKWVLLHDPAGPSNAAEVLLLVAGLSDTAARERIFDDVGRRLPELLSALRHRAVDAGLVRADDSMGTSPFGDAAPMAARPDPFIPADRGTSGTGRPGPYDPRPFDPFDEGA
jgi:hypothetical protein